VVGSRVGSPPSRPARAWPRSSSRNDVHQYCAVLRRMYANSGCVGPRVESGVCPGGQYAHSVGATLTSCLARLSSSDSVSASCNAAATPWPTYTKYTYIHAGMTPMVRAGAAPGEDARRVRLAWWSHGLIWMAVLKQPAVPVNSESTMGACRSCWHATNSWAVRFMPSRTDVIRHASAIAISAYWSTQSVACIANPVPSAPAPACAPVAAAGSAPAPAGRA
jgi:hypothetical protein